MLGQWRQKWLPVLAGPFGSLSPDCLCCALAPFLLPGTQYDLRRQLHPGENTPDLPASVTYKFNLNHIASCKSWLAVQPRAQRADRVLLLEKSQQQWQWTSSSLNPCTRPHWPRFCMGHLILTTTISCVGIRPQFIDEKLRLGRVDELSKSRVGKQESRGSSSDLSGFRGHPFSPWAKEAKI